MKDQAKGGGKPSTPLSPAEEETRLLAQERRSWLIWTFGIAGAIVVADHRRQHSDLARPRSRHDRLYKIAARRSTTSALIAAVDLNLGIAAGLSSAVLRLYEATKRKEVGWPRETVFRRS